MDRTVTALAAVLTLAPLLAAQAQPMAVPMAIQRQRLIYQVSPVYPKLAMQARIQGTVRLAALIDEDGVVDQLKPISGHPLLVKAAFDAVKQWRYLPALRNGVPVPVVTSIEITFSLKSGRPQTGQQHTYSA